jgi:hypothetical protein
MNPLTKKLLIRAGLILVAVLAIYRIALEVKIRSEIGKMKKVIDDRAAAEGNTDQAKIDLLYSQVTKYVREKHKNWKW